MFHGIIFTVYYLMTYIFHRIQGDTLFCLSNIVFQLLNLSPASCDDMKQVRFPFLSMLRKIPQGLKWQILLGCLVSALRERERERDKALKRPKTIDNGL